MKSIGIICPSDIAYRRFLPSLKKIPYFHFSGVAFASESEWPGASHDLLLGERKKAELIVEEYGGVVFQSYTEMICSDEIDAIYIPLPPSLHFVWAELALSHGKHVLVEKPATTNLHETSILVKKASSQNLALHENYMFVFHNQLRSINETIASGLIGDIRLYRISFGFPRRSPNDFRYKKIMGGGALLDAGGYAIKYASMLLGAGMQLLYAHSQFIKDFDVDISGSAAFTNDKGIPVQIAFGMDNDYKCDLEVWGSKGSMFTNRVLTAPPGYIPELTILTENKKDSIKLPEDDAFMKSILHFQNCIENDADRLRNFSEITEQASLVQQFIDKSKI